MYNGSTYFFFNRSTQRYHWKDTNKIVGVAVLRYQTNQSIEQNKTSAAEITQRMLDKKINVGEWENAIASQLKTATIQLYKLGKPELNQRDYGIIGSRFLKKQYAKLRKFSYDILTGGLSEAQIKARTNLYFNKLRGVFEDAQRESHKEARCPWERRKINSKEPCSKCPVYAAMGWQSVGTLPQVTEQCDCMANCKCTFEFSWSSIKPTEGLLIKNWGWL